MVMKETKILVVDDDRIVLDSCRRILEPEGFKVTIIPSANKALVLMNEDSFEIMLLDVKMPERDGLSLLEEVRNKWPDIPIIVMSGYPVPETIAEAMKLGASGFINKPFTPDELLGSVRRALNRE